MPGARHFSQLIAWQLADALRIEVLKLTQQPPCARDLKVRGQVEDAIDSVCRNIAEGFGADTHGQFVWYLRVSRRSLNELSDALRSALQKRYSTPADLSPAFALVRRLYPALNNFIAYLERTKDMRQGIPRTQERKEDRSDQREKDRTDNRKRDRTDRRKEDCTDPRQMNRTDPRKEDRTD